MTTTQTVKQYGEFAVTAARTPVLPSQPFGGSCSAGSCSKD